MKTSTSDRLPLSPTRSPKEGFVWWQSLLFAVLLACATFIPGTLVLAFMIVAGWAHLQDLQTLSWPLLVAQLVAYATVLGMMFPLLPALAHRAWGALGLRAPRPRDVGYALAGAAVMVLITAAVGAAQDAIFHLKPDEVQVHMLREARGVTVGIFVFFACVAAPFVEELVFRGFLFNALRRYLPTWLAVVLSAIAFGGSHFQPGNAGAIVPLVAGGIALAVVYARTGSLVASMVTHASFNFFTVLAVLVFHQT